jgi:hypothetical protein
LFAVFSLVVCTFWQSKTSKELALTMHTPNWASPLSQLRNVNVLPPSFCVHWICSEMSTAEPLRESSRVNATSPSAIYDFILKRAKNVSDGIGENILAASGFLVFGNLVVNFCVLLLAFSLSVHWAFLPRVWQSPMDSFLPPTAPNLPIGNSGHVL